MSPPFQFKIFLREIMLLIEVMMSFTCSLLLLLLLPLLLSLSLP